MGAGDMSRSAMPGARSGRCRESPHDSSSTVVYIHGEPGKGSKRGIALNSASTA